MSERVESGSVDHLLRDMAFDNPRPQERWFQRDSFDPMHGMKELRAAAKRGLIELDEEVGDKEKLRFRFTEKGRAYLETSDE